jgi:hypothetical protein
MSFTKNIRQFRTTLRPPLGWRRRRRRAREDAGLQTSIVTAFGAVPSSGAVSLTFDGAAA